MTPREIAKKYCVHSDGCNEGRWGNVDGTTVLELPNGKRIIRFGKLGKVGDKIRVEVHHNE